MAKTPRPSGLTLTRKGNKFTGQWKISADDYGDGQSFNYRLNSNSWKGIAIASTVTSKAFNIDLNSWYPNKSTKKLKKVSFRVRGNQRKYTSDNKTINPVVSEWSSKTFSIKPPKAPKITTTLGTWPSMRFSWTVDAKNDNATWFTNVYYESVVLRDCNISNGAKITESQWKSTQWGARYTNTGSASSSINIIEDSSRLADGHSYTRWFRIRSRGVAGASAWKYAKHVYTNSNAATITSYKIVKDENTSSYLCKVWFSSPKSVSRPIDKINIEYAIAIPDENMSCPDNASWNIGTSALAKDTDGGAIFSINSLLNNDYCLFVRVNTIHDEMQNHDGVTYGIPVLVDKGKLKAPSNLSVTTNISQHTATVTADNESNVVDSFLVIKFYTLDNPDGVIVGTIPHGETTAIVQCPPWESTDIISFGVYAVVGDYETPDMISDVTKDGGSIPLAPVINVKQSDISGTITVSWDWSWDKADRAEISWSNHPDAWESTDPPSTFEVTKLNSSVWNISGLESGLTWYVRVRLLSGTGENVAYGEYSIIHPQLLSSAPNTPALSLSEGIIQEDGQVNASWVYSTTDGTAQSFAVLAEYINGEYVELEQVETAQQVSIVAAEQNDGEGWRNGETHLLAVKVVSASGRESDWSDTVPVIIAEPPTCDISASSLEYITMESTDEEGAIITWQQVALTSMDMELTVVGAGENGTTSVIIERAESYHVDRPDESDFNGYEGEAVYIQNQTGEAPITISLDDLIGKLDDTAAYRIIATVQDENGQSATATAVTLKDETVVDDTVFEVHWEQQALQPDATVEIIPNSLIAILTPIAPAEARESDRCDIYRLSIDKPELIIKDAIFGVQYVDPYPTIGDYGGHRFVFKTENGDYITQDNKFAWKDTKVDENDYLEFEQNIIDFDSGRALLQYNVELSNSWTKDFQETQYLGGSVQGDWNKAVSRSSSMTVSLLADQDQDMIETMRRLATAPNICHVRTKDGSSYNADVQVTEKYSQNDAHKIIVFDLKITRVEPEELDGLTYAEWLELHEGDQ